MMMRTILRPSVRFRGGSQDTLKSSTDNYMNKLEQVHATNIALEKETSNNLVVDRTNVSDGFPVSLDVYNTSQNSESNDIIPGISSSGLIEWHQPDTHNLSLLPAGGSGFPKFAQMFVDAIKKNRACQKFLRSKLIQIEARIEENKRLKQRVKILKDFQVSCKKRTGRALSLKKDARVQLISAIKPWATSKVSGKKISPLYYGPNENSHVASYRMVLKKCPISLNRQNWSDEEKENLAKGIKQQFQEMLLQKSVDLISDVEGSGDPNGLDSIITSIRDVDITPENMRSFLPKVNWERLASMYVTGRSGPECEARWLNCEDPLINHHPWTKLEDKKLLHIVQQRGISDWIDIAALLGTNRTPFQCLARYQRSLNASIMKREWTEDEDDKLRAAVEALGESNWQLVASTLEGRTGTQCSNRWIKSLHPIRQRVGRWSSDEDKRLKVAVMFFGPKTWKKIAQFVPGRTHVQCRERWFNSLDPSLNMGEWTEEEDSLLKAAIAEHGYCWSKVAACVRPRTDNQCRRRWKDLCPHEVPLLQAARKIQKAALISNFVDRESERPALGPNDFKSLALTNAVSESENLNPSRKQKRKSRFKRSIKEAQICSDEVLLLTNGTENENYAGGGDSISKKREMKPRAKKKSSKPTQDVIRNDFVWPSDGWTKKKRSLGRQKRKFRGTLEAVSREDAISNKEKTMKPYSNENGSTDPRSAQLSARDSELAFADDAAGKKNACKRRSNSKYSLIMQELLEIPDSSEDEAFGKNDALSKKKRDMKQSLKKCAGRNHPSSSKSSKTTENKVEAFSGNAATKKRRASKPCSSKCTDPPKHNKNLSVLPSDMEVRRANGNGGSETSAGDITTLHSNQMASGFKQSRECEDYTTSFIEVAKMKPKQSETTKLVEGFQNVFSDKSNSRASDICRQERLKGSKTRGETCSDHRLEAEDGNDMTLAFFIKNRLKKRRLKLAEMGNDASCHSSMKGSESIFEGSGCNNGRNDVLSSQAMQLCHSEDPPGIVAAGDLDIGKSHSVAVGISPFRESLKEQTATDLEGLYKASDDQ